MSAVAAEPARERAVAESLRTALTVAAPLHADLVIEQLVEAIKATKHVSVTCRKCNTTTRAEINDAAASVRAIQVLLEQTEGRPGVAEEANSTLTVQRIRLDPADLELQAVLGQAAIERALRLLDKGNVDELKALLMHHAPRA